MNSRPAAPVAAGETGVTTAALANAYPRLYHMAALGAWPSIRRHGLLSTSTLLDLFEITGAARKTLERTHRPTSTVIRHPRLGTATVRDQIPMSDSGLERALRDGITPPDWYELLNERVFFWLNEERLERMLSAAAYRDQSHTVLVLDTESLVSHNVERVRLSPLNSGCTKPFPHPRGRTTFLPISEYPFAERVRRARANAVVELAVIEGVRDIERHVIEVRNRSADDYGEVIWRPGDV